MSVLSIKDSFSEFTGLRHCNISDNSGEEFYHKILNKAFKEAFEKQEQLVIILDKVDGYASSFLDEAFGNLVYDFHLINVKKSIQIISEQEPHWKDMIENKTYNEWESRRLEGETPKITASHEPWYRLIGKDIKLNVWEEFVAG